MSGPILPPRRKKAEPFAALLANSTLLLGLLFVAGFAFRWSYYYNFGVQHLVFSLGYQSFLVAAFELIRTWTNARLVLWYVGLPLLIAAVFVALLRQVARSERLVARKIRWVGDETGVSSPLVLDLLRTAIVIIGTFRAGYVAGYTAFQTGALNTGDNPLPVVTVLYGGSDPNLPSKAIRCGADPDGNGENLAFVGGNLAHLQQFRQTCNDKVVTWRLLYRDDSFIYVFASEGTDPKVMARPLTLILPNAKDAVVVLK